MEQDTAHPDLAGFSISETDLMSMQGGVALVAGVAPDSTSSHLSQGDLDALASIQEELDRMNSGSQTSLVGELSGGGGGLGGLGGEQESPGLLDNFGGAGTLGGLGGGQADLLAGQNIAVVTSLPGQLKVQDKPTVRVVKRPASTSTGQLFNKVRIGDSNQQFRIVSNPSLAGLSIGGQQVKLVNNSGNLKTIVPSSAASLAGSISIVNPDGSLTAIPVQSATQPGQYKVGGAVQTGLGGTVVKVAKQPQQIRIVPSQQQQQTFKILNADGSLSDVSSSFIRPKSDLKSIPSSVSSPKKKVTYSTISVKSPQKMLSIKPEQGQIIKTSDGRFISLQQAGPAKKVVVSGAGLPAGLAASPTKIVIRDGQPRLGNGLVPGSPGRPTGQLVHLQGEQHLSTQPEKVQFVRVVNSSGKSQTVPVRAAGGPGQSLSLRSLQTGSQSALPQQQPRHAGNSVQGIKSVVPAGVQRGEFNCQQLRLIIHSLHADDADITKMEKDQYEEMVKDKPSRIVTNIEPQGVRPRKPCNCTKSQCLKLYCDCFANGRINCTALIIDV